MSEPQSATFCCSFCRVLASALGDADAVICATGYSGFNPVAVGSVDELVSEQQSYIRVGFITTQSTCVSLTPDHTPCIGMPIIGCLCPCTLMNCLSYVKLYCIASCCHCFGRCHQCVTCLQRRGQFIWWMLQKPAGSSPSSCCHLCSLMQQLLGSKTTQTTSSLTCLGASLTINWYGTASVTAFKRLKQAAHA